MEGEHKTTGDVVRAVGDVKQGRGEKDVQGASGWGATLAQVKRVIDVFSKLCEPIKTCAPYFLPLIKF